MSEKKEKHEDQEENGDGPQIPREKEQGEKGPPEQVHDKQEMMT
ncbi:hypothetical protein PAA26_04495 [Methanomassiliicoccaceae archaeon COG_1]|nr:hypothetical protein [Methanomassiliicoccaceae archaeon COG_1]